MPLVRRDPVPAAKAVGTASEAPRDLATALGREKDLRNREAILASSSPSPTTRPPRRWPATSARRTPVCETPASKRCRPCRPRAVGPARPARRPGRGRQDPRDGDRPERSRRGRRTRPVGAALGARKHPNVCGAAVEVLAEVGSQKAVPALTAAKARFAGEAFLSMAIDTVLARIGSER